MRIAILAGAFALAAPVVADAATYRLDYVGSASFVAPLEGSLSGVDIAFGSAEEDAVFDQSPSFLIKAPDNAASTTSVGWTSWYDVDPDSRYGPVGSVQASYFGEDFSPFFQDGVTWAYAELDVEISADGDLVSASAALYDQYDFVYFLEQGELTVYSDFYGGLYEGPGEFTLTRLGSPEVAPVPLPATAPLIAIGLAALGWARRRQA